MPDYSKTIIYKLMCNDENITDFYIGHTTDFNVRKGGHKSYCNNINKKEYNFKVYKFIRENGGWCNWQMIKIEHYPCNNKKEAEQRERYWVEELKATLNAQIPSRDQKEYKEQNADKIKEYKKEYYEQNADKIKEYKKEYREQNANKIKKQKKEYYEKNAEKIKKLIICECGCEIMKKHLKRHQQTAKHINLISNK
jgi:hypothetical protein